jgi:WD40 repeat protein
MAPNASLAASFGESGTICLFDMASFAMAAKINTSLHEVTSAAFAPDSKQLLAGGRLPEGNSQLRAAGIWEAATGDLIRDLPVPGPAVTAVAYAPDGSRVVTATSDDKQLHVFDPVRGAVMLSFSAGPADITCLQFVPDSTRLLSGGKDSMLRLWDIQTGQQIHELSGHLAAIVCLDITGDGRLAVSGSLDGTARLWNLVRGCKLDDYQIDGELGHLRDVVFAPDDNSLWAGYSRGATVFCPLREILDYPELPQQPPTE